MRRFSALMGMVTFRQTDPFYMVDISRPASPRLLGELKIPGVSAYLHPVGGGRVLGIGRDGTRDRRLRGVQLSLFDVVDPTRPLRTDTLELGPGRAAAAGESRAFTYLPARDLAVIVGRFDGAVRCTSVDLEWTVRCRTRDARLAEGVLARGHPEAREARLPAVVGVRVTRSGELREVARYLPSSGVQRVLPVGDRLAVLTRTAVVMLDAAALRPVGSVEMPA